MGETSPAMNLRLRAVRRPWAWALPLVLLLSGTHARADGAYYQTFKPRITGRLHQGAACGEPQQTVIMSDQPRQAATAAMRDPCLAVKLAENAYAAAVTAEQNGSPTCVDLYFETITFSWHFLKSRDAARRPQYARTWQVYHSGLAKLITTAQQYGRLDARHGLRVNTAVGPQVIRLAFHGFLWKPEDFNEFTVVTDAGPRKLDKHYAHDGFGVPLVVTRQRAQKERFFSRKLPFAATAILRPSLAALSGRAPPAGEPLSHGPLELYDPLRVCTVPLHGQQVRMASDTSAPFEMALKDARDYPYKGLLQPGSRELRQQLFMIEPYQPNKYPIVFVHGLMSSPNIWVTLANEIMARPDLRSRFQLWAFVYPTGKGFLNSAAFLRHELKAAVRTFDPMGEHLATSEMVMLGHSMGGLVTKLQVTSSDDTLWYSIANRPLNEIRVTDETRNYLRDLLYFKPLPFITRVVFIGTPHAGSTFATLAIGRCSSRLIQQPTSDIIRHQIVVAQNPGVFSPEVRDRLPTSVDMLEPQSRILQAIQKLCPGPNVQLHSIIGTGCFSLFTGHSDGPVAVSSARHPYVSTEKFVHTTHGKLHEKQDSLEEIMCILRRHVRESLECPELAPPDSFGWSQ